MKSKRLLKIHLSVFILSVLLIFTESYALQLNAQGISGHFSKSDRKDLEDASKAEEQAEELINEANSIYTEIYNTNTGQSDQKRKSKQLEDKALKKQLKAEALYASSNATRYKIYKYHITKQKEESKLTPSDLNKVRLLEEQADENYSRAHTLRQDGKKLKDDKLQYSKFTKANDYEKKALQEQLDILKIFFGDSATGISFSDATKNPAVNNSSTKSSKTAAVPDQKVVIDSVRVRAIQNKLKYLSDESSFNIDSLNGLDKRSLSRAWFNYLYTDTSEYTSENYQTTHPAIPNTAQKQVMTDNDTPSVPATTGNDAENSTKENYQPLPENKKGNSSATKQLVVQNKAEQISNVTESSNTAGSTYMVQIAADRAPLSQETLRKIYSGNKNITTVRENGWNKYSIGPFSSFEEAQQFKKSCGVKNAFISSTLKENEKTKQHAEPQPRVKKPTQEAVKEVRIQDNQIIFRVQIAASREPLSRNKIQEIYNGDLPVNMHREEGWYKYSIGETGNYDQARNTQKQITVKGSFIAAYQSGNKLKLYEAIRLNRLNSARSSNDVLFFVQIAASKHPMKQFTLKKIYQGDNEILMKRENGWYKYRIFAGETYRQAASFKRQLSVAGAFVVAYQHDKKIPLQSAISLTK